MFVCYYQSLFNIFCYLCAKSPISIIFQSLMRPHMTVLCLVVTIQFRIKQFFHLRLLLYKSLLMIVVLKMFFLFCNIHHYHIQRAGDASVNNTRLASWRLTFLTQPCTGLPPPRPYDINIHTTVSAFSFCKHQTEEQTRNNCSTPQMTLMYQRPYFKA